MSRLLLRSWPAWKVREPCVASGIAFDEIRTEVRALDPLGGQARAALEPWPTAVDQATAALTALPDLVARLAAERRHDTGEPTVSRLAQWPGAIRPAHVPELVWQDFLSGLLRRCGLLVERGGDFTFIHETIADYLAARHATADPQTSLNAFKTSFGRLERVWRRRDWYLEGSDVSYYSFLIAAWNDDATAELAGVRRRLSKTLLHLATRCGISGCQDITDLVRLTTPLPPDVVHAAAENAVTVARGSKHDLGDRVQAACVLAELHDPRAATVLTELATTPVTDRPDRPESSPTLVNIRLQAAEILLQLREGHERDVLALMTTDRTLATNPYHAPEPTLATDGRLWAAETLVNLGDPRGTTALLEFISDPTEHTVNRVKAARTVPALTDSAADALYAMTATERYDFRILVAEALARHRDPRGAEALYAIASQPTDGYYFSRRNAGRALARLGDPRGAQTLFEWAMNTDEDSRLYFATALLDIDDPRGEQAILAVANQADADASIRADAAAALADSGNDRGTQLLLTWATDTAQPGRLRVCAASRLVEQRSPAMVELLASLAVDLDLDPTNRLEAARLLADIDEQRATDAMYALSTDVGLDLTDRQRAASRLAALKDHRGIELLLAWAEDPSIPPNDRRAAAEKLIQAEEPRGQVIYDALNDN